jgi:hypothetical protein
MLRMSDHHDDGPPGAPLRRRALLLLLLFGGAAVYLAARLPRYWGDGTWLTLPHAASLGAALCHAAVALGALLRRPGGGLGRALPRRASFWRYLLYAAFLLILIPCLIGPENPRPLFRASLLILFLPLTLALLWPGWRARLGRWRRRKPLRLLDIALFNLILLALILEAGLRLGSWLAPGPLLSRPEGKAVKHVRDYKLTPGQKHNGFPANALGFYDEPFRRTKPPQTLRIAAAADSFGVETVPHTHNFLTLLETELERHRPPPPRPEVMNLSVDATSPAAYLYLLNQYYIPYDADAALVCVFLGNDILWLPERQRSMPFLRRQYWSLYLVGSRLVALAAEDLRREGGPPPDPGGHGWTPPPPGEERPTYSRESFLEIERRRLRVCLRAGRSAFVDRKYREFAELLPGFRRLAGKHLLFVLIPDEFQVSDALWEELMQIVPQPPEAYERDRPQRVVSAACEEQGIRVLDLTPLLRAAHREAPVYHRRDTHWNARGHALASVAIAKRLAPLLPSPASSAGETAPGASPERSE